MAKNHYVPQFFLKNFAALHKDDKVYAYERNKKPFLVSSKNIAAKNNFYVFVDKRTGKKSDLIEREFSDVEEKASPIINRLIKSNDFKLNNKERNLLAYFITGLALRNLSFREKSKNLYIQFVKQTTGIIAQNKKTFEKKVKKSGIKIKEKKFLEDLRKKLANKDYKLGLKGGDDFFMKGTLKLLIKLTPIVFFKEWQLMEITGSNKVFVTSDNPVSLIRPENFRAVGFLNANIALPISPKRCLLLLNETEYKHKGENFITISREMVDHINRHTMFFAHNFIFSSIISKDIENLFKETTKGESEKILVC